MGHHERLPLHLACRYEDTRWKTAIENVNVIRLIYEGYKDAANVIDGLGMAPALYLQWHSLKSLSLVPTTARELS
jgi:hypothetical protein